MSRDSSPPAASRSTTRAESLARLDAVLVGSSAALRRLKSQLLGLAGLPFPVLFSGEPGSGRRRAAQALHAIGPWADAPLLELEGRTALPAGGLPARGAVIVANVDTLPAELQALWSRIARGRALGPRLLATASASFPLRAFDDGFDPELAAALLRFAVQVPRCGNGAATCPSSPATSPCRSRASSPVPSSASRKARSPRSATRAGPATWPSCDAWSSAHSHSRRVTRSAARRSVPSSARCG